MIRVLFDDVVRTDYGHFTIKWDRPDGWDGNPDSAFAGQENGLVGAADDRYIFIVLARRRGGSSVRIELSETEPEDDPSWEDCVEVSVSVPQDADPQWASWADMSSGTLDLPPGAYRLRVLARGREAGSAGEFAMEVVDFYCLQFWPDEYRPDEIVRVGGPEAEYWHQAAGHRRDQL